MVCIIGEQTSALDLHMRLFRLGSALASLLSLLAVSACADGRVSGTLVDYRNDEPIANAAVTLSRIGWGRSGGQLVWDRTYTATTRTAADGTFDIPDLGLAAPAVTATEHADLAIELLNKTSQSVASIGSSLGFEDPSYFSRFFRKMTKVSPEQFKNEIRKQIGTKA